MRLLVVGLILLSSCAFWQKIDVTLDQVSDTAQTTFEAFGPVINSICDQRVTKCIEAGDAECKPLKECDNVRNYFALTFARIQQAVLAAKIARAIGDEAAEVDSTQEAVGLLKELQGGLKQLGFIK